MSVSEFSVRKPVFMGMVYALLIIVACVFVPRLDQALFPKMDLPYVAVVATCGDADPDSIEMQVTKTLENSVSGVEHLKKIRSFSVPGYSQVILEFTYGTDVDKAESDVSSLLSMVTRYLPSWVSAVNTLQISTVITSQAFMTLTVDGPYPLDELKNIASSTIEPLLTRIDGVGDVEVSGGGNIEFHVKVDPNRLAAYNLTLSQIVAAVSAENNMGTGGDVTSGSVDYNVMTDSRYTAVSDMLNTKVATVGGKNIYVKDVARVVKTTEKGAAVSYLDGNPTVSIAVYESSDASVSAVAKKVRKALPSINESLPNGVSVSVRRDNSKNISAVINETYSSLFWGMVFAAIVIFIFLVDIRSTIIIALSMPLCVLFTMMLMSMCDISMNIVSMSGLILGIGMIVDASIVILENITTYRQQGETAPAAAILGSRNMILAITASTLTTICVFLPVIIFMNQLEIMGQMLKDMVFTVCFSLICSLFVSVTIVPSLAGAIIPIKTTTQREYKGFMKKFDDRIKAIEARLESGYGRMLSFFLAYKRFLIIPLALLFLMSISFFPHIGKTLMPNSSQGDSLRLSLKLPEGTTRSVTEKYVMDMQEEVIRTFPEGSFNSIMARIDGNEGTLTVMLPDLSKQKYSAVELRNMIKPALVRDATAVWTYSSGQMMGSSKPIDIEVTGDSIDGMIKLSNEIVALLQEKAPMLTNTTSDLMGGAPRVKVMVDKERADALGITPSTVSSILLTAISGSKATQVSTMSNVDSYYVRVLIDEEYMKDLSSLNALLVPSNAGFVRLDSIATLYEDTSPSTIRREDKRRINHVSADLVENYPANKASQFVKELLDENIAIPDGISVNMAGDAADFAKYTPYLILVVILSLALVFGVMAAQFESLINPFIVFATIPLLVIGVIVIHLLKGQDFSIMSVIGVVALIGTVVNNGIVLVDAISREIKDYRTPVEEACLKCAKERLRPILMTTLTTVVGMIPMAFFPGDGAEQMQPVALTFIGGLITGAFLTLFLSPVLFAIFNRKMDDRMHDPSSHVNLLKQFDGRIG